MYHSVDLYQNHIIKGTYFGWITTHWEILFLEYFIHIILGTPLTALKTIDEDRDQEFQYRLIEDSSGLFSVVNGSLISSVKFNFEEDAGKEFQIKIQSDDNGLPSYGVSAEKSYKSVNYIVNSVCMHVY